MMPVLMIAEEIEGKRELDTIYKLLLCEHKSTDIQSVAKVV
jgi:hypothetical protein